MYSTYFKVKTGLNSKVDSVIHRAEVAINHSYNIKNPTLSKSIIRTAKSVCEYGQLFLDFPRLDAYRMVGSRESIIYVGTEYTGRKIITNVLFPEGYDETELGRVPVWQLPALAKEWLEEVDLVAFRVSRKFPYRLEAPYIFENPVTVTQVLPLGKPLEEILAGKEMADLRHNLNRVRRANFTDKFSRSMADLDYFYQQMYIPSAKNRFGERAELIPYGLLEAVMKRGGLLLISLDNQPVAGSLMDQQGTTCIGSFSGLLDGNLDLLKQGVGIVIYWRSIKWAIEQGFKEFNLWGSSAWQSDGVFQTKRKWGPTVVGAPWEHTKLIFAANHLSAERREHLNRIGFLTCVGGKHLQVYIDELSQPDIPADIETKKEQALKSGLNGIQVVGRGYRRNHFI